MKIPIITNLIFRKAFSLVEFIVIISIFAIMAGVALFNYSGFNSTVSLNNLAHDIALTIRQAQVYGISATEGDSGNVLAQIRGVYFPYASSGFDPNFIIFMDADSDTTVADPFVQYSQNIDVIIDQVGITTQDRIVQIETGASASGASACQSEVVIAFMRPDPDPIIYCGQTEAQFARITVQSANGNNEQHVEIWPTGQIAVVHQETTGGN